MGLQSSSKDADQLEASQLRAALRAQERDLQFLAYDIHDGLLAYLIGAWLHFNCLNLDPATLSSDNANRLELMRALMQMAINEGRRLIKGVRPPILDEKGILGALQDLVESKAGTSNVDIEFQAETSSTKYS